MVASINGWSINLCKESRITLSKFCQKKNPNKRVKNKYVIKKVIFQKAGPNLVQNQFLIDKKITINRKIVSKIKGFKIKIMVLT